MRKLIPLLALVLTIISTVDHLFSQSPGWNWAKSAGGTYDDRGQSVVSDASGNVLVTGFFGSASITFGSVTLTGVGEDIFIVKYDPSGNVIWAKSAGGTSDDGGRGIAVDQSGNVIITGYFKSPSIVFGTTTLINSGLNDIFVAKYDPSGNLLWAVADGSSTEDQGNSVCVDASGSIFVTGQSGNAVFINKYDSIGNGIWSNTGVSQGSTNGFGVSTDAKGEIYATGYFTGPYVNFAGFILYNTNSASADIFIIKYDTAGNVIWAKSAGGMEADIPGSISVSADGNFCVTGYFISPSIVFGPITLTNASSGFTSDMFIAKYDSLGTILWAKVVGTTGQDRGQGISMDINGNVVATGYASFTSMTIGVDTLVGAGAADMIIVKYNSAGIVLWAKSAGGTSGDQGQGICIDGNGSILVAGWLGSVTAAFESIILNSIGMIDVVVAKLNGVTGLPEEEVKGEIKIFPNPFSEHAILLAENPFKNMRLTLFNSLGQEIKHITNISGQTFTLQRDNLPAGVYFIRLVEKGRIFKIDKLVVMD